MWIVFFCGKRSLAGLKRVYSEVDFYRICWNLGMNFPNIFSLHGKILVNKNCGAFRLDNYIVDDFLI